jgi:hypothetical protein
MPLNVTRLIGSAQKCWEAHYTFARKRCMNYPVGEENYYPLQEK